MKPKMMLALALLLIASERQLSAVPIDPQKLVTANNAFAFRLLRQIAKEQPAANIFISPYGAATVLQMATAGAAGKTSAEMQQVLGTTNLSPAEMGGANQAVAQSLNTEDTNVILTTANAIWYRRGAPVKPDFMAFNRQYFGSTVDSLDFEDPHSVDIINQWASNQTHGKINQLANGPLDPDTELFLANAVYFKGRWSDPFDVQATSDRPFHRRVGGDTKIPMMTKTKTFTYRHGAGYQAVRLPYLGENLGMYVFLPDTNSSPEKLLRIMTGDTWQRITKPGFSEKEGTLMLPRFKLEYGVELKEPLQALGMKSAFDAAAADFSGIAPQLYISAARQKTFVEVKEDGTEAAAVTGMSWGTAGIEMPPPDPFQMIVDRPFLFLIADDQTGTILFTGVIFDPAAN